MKCFSILFSSLFFVFLAKNSVAELATVKVDELLMADDELTLRYSAAGAARTLTYFINTQENSDYETPEEWQYTAIRESIARASSILNVLVTETTQQSQADVDVFIHKAQNRDSLSGRWGEDLSINISHQSGLGENKEAIHRAGERSVWRNIFLHELGHFLGLEHPWDKDDGDWTVDEWSDSHSSTRMGYNEHLDGEYSWYSDIDLEALQKIWGKGEWLGLYSGIAPPAGLEINFNNIGTFNSSDQTIYTCLRVFTDGFPGSVGKIDEYDIGLKIYSLQNLTFQASKIRDFNSIKALKKNGETPDCSGKFETTTGVFTDIIQAGDSTYEIIFSLTDSTNLLLKVQSYKILPKLSSVSALTFNPAKYSKTMPVEKDIDITFSSTIKKGEGVITLKDSAGNTVESYQAGVSSNITVSGSVLSINPTAILASDKSYFINIPAGAVRDSVGNNFKGVVDHEFKTQIDVAFMLMGYNGTTVYETTDSFKAAAELATTQMGLLSFNRLKSYRTHMLPISPRDGDYIQSKVEIELIDAALDNWGPENVFTNFYYQGKTKPDALRNPSAEQINVLTTLRQWLVENEKAAADWKDTDLGKVHYQWILNKVLIFCSPAARGMFDGVRMPAGFDVKEYKVISIILSSDDSYNVGAAASSFSSWGGNHWNISNSEGVKYTDYQLFFFDDHSDINSGTGEPEKLKIANAKVDVHEYIHTQGGEHDDYNSTCVSPYSVMSACDTGDFFNYPIYNRIYITGWLPETAITTNPSLVQDSYNATDPTKKYLLKLGNFQYQELFNGTWYQYSVRSFDKQMNICNSKELRPDGTVIGGGWLNVGDEKSIDSLYTCGQLVLDPACIVTGLSPIPGLNGEIVAGRNFSNCEFIDIENELSRGLFLKFLGRMDGSRFDFSGSIDRNALVMEITDDAARQALSN